MGEQIAELEGKIEMYEFFYEGNGFKKRGLNNSIQIAEYIDKLEEQIEQMKIDLRNLSAEADSPYMLACIQRYCDKWGM